jgi:hypothetical protein
VDEYTGAGHDERLRYRNRGLCGVSVPWEESSMTGYELLAYALKLLFGYSIVVLIFGVLWIAACCWYDRWSGHGN